MLLLLLQLSLRLLKVYELVAVHSLVAVVVARTQTLEGARRSEAALVELALLRSRRYQHAVAQAAQLAMFSTLPAWLSGRKLFFRVDHVWHIGNDLSDLLLSELVQQVVVELEVVGDPAPVALTMELADLLHDLSSIWLRGTRKISSHLLHALQLVSFLSLLHVLL